jgi:hypothetical protein
MLLNLWAKLNEIEVSLLHASGELDFDMWAENSFIESRRAMTNIPDDDFAIEIKSTSYTFHSFMR